MTTTATPSPLTPCLTETLAAIRAYVTKHGHAPTMDEIADRLDVAKPTAWELVGKLEQRGYLTRERRRARSIRLTEDVNPWRDVAMAMAAYIDPGEWNPAKHDLLGRVMALLVREGR